MQTVLLLLLGVIALALFSGILFVASVAGAALRRAIRFSAVARREAATIAELQSGERRVRGFVAVPGDGPEARTLTSPLSGRPCVYYELSGTYMGRPCFSHRESLPCALNDGSGELALDALSLELLLREGKAWRGVSPERIPPGIGESLQSRLIKAHADLAVRDAGRGLPVAFDLLERALHVGEPLYVSGTIIRVGPSVSFVGGRDIVASDRPFSEIARREAMIAFAGLGLALLVVSVLVSIARVILVRTAG